MEVMTEKEMERIRLATIYELRLVLTQGKKETYTTEEITELLDKLATAKE